MIKTLGNTIVYHQLAKKQLVNGPLMVFIPGNPGVINYYIPYFKLLGSRLPTVEILGISQTGHQIPEKTGDKSNYGTVVGLQGQIDHKVALIEEFLGDGGDRDVLIMGHSVGTWMIERIVLKLGDRVNFKFIGFITPTIIDIHKSDKGKAFAPLIKIFPVVNLILPQLSHLLRLIPDKFVNFLLSKVLKNPPDHALESTKLFITNPQQITQSIGLAHEELQVIQNDWDFFENEFLQQTLSIPKWFYFSNVDHWVNNNTQAEITEKVERLENVTVESSDEIVHSFCINQSEEFAEITTRALENLYKY